jgi:hypothetical protein
MVVERDIVSQKMSLKMLHHFIIVARIIRSDRANLIEPIRDLDIVAAI